MMFTRVAPLRLKFSPIGSRTFVASTISSRMPFKALPNSVSLSPRLYTSAVSMKFMPPARRSLNLRLAPEIDATVRAQLPHPRGVFLAKVAHVHLAAELHAAERHLAHDESGMS